MVASYDCVIRGGTVVDGTGHDPFIGDVAIKDGRIVEVGQIAGSGADEINAAGRLVTPGFIDIHTHYDGQAIWSSRMNPSSSHGVTTVVMGNCGVGFAPCRKDDHDMLINVMEGVEDIPGAVMSAGLAWDWETFPEYLDALDARPRDIDTAAYLPHSPLRVYAMGERGANREAATPDDLARMRGLAREAIEAGAMGFATSRLHIHRTADGAAIPSFATAETELQAITGGMKDAGKGIIQMVMDFPDENWENLAMLRRLAQQSGRPATFTMGSGNSGPEGWREGLKRVEDANANGVSITAQVFPRPIGLVQGHNLSINPFSECPTYKAMAGLSLEERIAEMRKPETRAKLVKEKPGEGTMLAMLARNYDWMFPLSDPPDYEPSAETSVGATARRLGLTPEEVIYDMLLKDDGKAMVYVALGNFYNAKLDSVGEMLQHKNTVLGLGDGGAHYGMICDASYPTFMLSHWTRDRAEGRLPIAWAVKALAQDPARAVGLNDRGILAPGYKADINIIDYDNLALNQPTVVHDLPAGGRRLDQTARGYDVTMVAGKVIYRGGEPTGELPGRLVRGPQEIRPN
ncbi:MAG: amidohydrolase [Rhodospirillales bacterium]|nr:amidohydrolase [Rhodospirillales bacterium]